MSGKRRSNQNSSAADEQTLSQHAGTRPNTSTSSRRSKHPARAASPESPSVDERNVRASKRQKRAPANARSDYFESEQSAEIEDASDGDFEDDIGEGVGEQGDDYEDEDEDDGHVDESAPMRSRIIPVKEEVMRQDGGIDYAEDHLHPNTMLFLRDLKNHNKRDWLKSHDGEYRRAYKDWESFVDTTTHTVTEVDETVPELPFKDVNFRIHRDVRFSKDPTPYKPHFSAAFSRTGRKGPYACYYVHCKPGESFIGGGLWCPGPDALRALRRSIDRHPDQWYSVFNQRPFNRTFLRSKDIPMEVHYGGDRDYDPKEAFYYLNQAHALQRWPKGYDRNHPNLELIKLKSFTVSRSVDDDFWTYDNVQEKLAEIVAALQPFVTFLNDIVMPDPDAHASEDSDENA